LGLLCSPAGINPLATKALLDVPSLRTNLLPNAPAWRNATLFYLTYSVSKISSKNFILFRNPSIPGLAAVSKSILQHASSKLAA